MNGDRTIMVEILNAIEHGTLSVHETRRRLEDIIDKEIIRTDAPANVQLVEECEKLLWELSTGSKLSHVDHLDENKAATWKRIKKYRFFRSFSKNAIRVGTIAAALVICSIGVEWFLHIEWLAGKPTVDEQQFIIHGKEFDPNTVEISTAEDAQQHPDSLSTTNYVEAIKFLGFDPFLSLSPMEPWNIAKYTCSRSVDDSTLYVDYVNQENDIIKLTIVCYNNIEDAVMYIEQNSTGEFIKLTNHNIYVTQNHNRTIAIWNVDSSVYSIRSNLTPSETITFIESVFEEK